MPPPHAIRYELRENMKEVVLEQWQLFSVFDAVSLQCLWLIVEEAICSQCWNKVHDKVAYRSMAHFAKHRKKKWKYLRWLMKVLSMADESTFDGWWKYFRWLMKVLSMGNESIFVAHRKYLRFLGVCGLILKGLMQIFNAISAKNLLIQVFYFLYGYPLTCCKWGSLSL